ncbi:RNA polymerase sigma-70 factor [Paludibacter sp. 221]|uniref:RNA polymerase sigma-70 factor n=1 Tax=Paludibacter sp. 221 TaxID=2302939 RepID=UPI0013D6A15E|nr:RNA polymerase sigma-70 factor [Paludibacter sp. 221]NDV46665.1 RNA polymerase sigma-70 factor [Paludibacter sp. 221]
MRDVDEILNLLSVGDRAAFNRFYDLYYDQVFHFALYFLREKEACKEIVSDVFLSIWQSRAKLPEIKNIETWLYVLTKNRSIRYLSNLKKENHISLDEDVLKLSVHYHRKEENVTPDDILQDKEIELILSDTINTLPEKCRIIFMMSRNDGLKNKEIAEILSLQESTVRVQLKIAIEKIVAAITPHFPNLFS